MSWGKSFFVFTFLVLVLVHLLDPEVQAWAAQERTWPVAATNLELDQTKVEEGASLSDYLKGAQGRTGSLYVKDVLANPEDGLGLTLEVPCDPILFQDQACREMEVTGFVLHPTSTDNERSDYSIPGYDVVLPRMTRSGQEELWPGEGGPWPLLVYSHGMSVFPGWAQEMEILQNLASQGYIVVCLFHGDNRFDPDYQTMQAVQLALRTVTLKQTLDHLETDYGWASRIDWSRVGGLGVSYGGSSMLAWSGAGVIDLETGLVAPILCDSRVKASAGVVSFSGTTLLPVFGWSAEGGETLSAPQMIICGENDLLAPCIFSRELLRNSTWRNYLVTLMGEGHLVSDPLRKDALGWLSVYFAAMIKEDPEALEILHTRTSSPGGGEDYLEIVDPAPYQPGF